MPDEDEFANWTADEYRAVIRALREKLIANDGVLARMKKKWMEYQEDCPKELAEQTKRYRRLWEDREKMREELDYHRHLIEAEHFNSGTSFFIMYQHESKLQAEIKRLTEERDSLKETRAAYAVKYQELLLQVTAPPGNGDAVVESTGSRFRMANPPDVPVGPAGEAVSTTVVPE